MTTKFTYKFCYANGDSHSFLGVEDDTFYPDGSVQLVYNKEDPQQELIEVAPGYRYVTITREEN